MDYWVVPVKAYSDDEVQERLGDDIEYWNGDNYDYEITGDIIKPIVIKTEEELEKKRYKEAKERINTYKEELIEQVYKKIDLLCF